MYRFVALGAALAAALPGRRFLIGGLFARAKGDFTAKLTFWRSLSPECEGPAFEQQ